MHKNVYRNSYTRRDFQYVKKMEIACIKKSWLFCCSEYGKRRHVGDNSANIFIFCHGHWNEVCHFFSSFLNDAKRVPLFEVIVQGSYDRIPVYTGVVDLGKFTTIIFRQVGGIYVFMERLHFISMEEHPLLQLVFHERFEHLPYHVEEKRLINKVNFLQPQWHCFLDEG